MVRTALAVRRIPMPRQHNVGLQFRGARRGGIEVVDLEPEQDAVAIRPVVAIAEGTVVVRDVERVQLHHQPVTVYEPLVLGPAVVAAAPEEPLIPPAAGFDVRHDEERLGSHRSGGILKGAAPIAELKFRAANVGEGYWMPGPP